MSTKEVAPTTKQEVTGAEDARAGRWYTPTIDVLETDSAVTLWADMPGVDEKSVRVDFDDGVLTIEGNVSVADYEGLHPLYTEYNVGNFSRRLRLADRFDVTAIRARMKSGVLELTLPKVERIKAHRIEVHGD